MDTVTIGVVGLGLIGGSLCKALGANGHRILGWDTDEHVRKYAALTGVIREELTDERVPECDYLFLAVCDICGVKRTVCEPCFGIAEEYGFTYIGGHPMAGKQFSGIKYADADLFRGATMILVPKEHEDLFVVSRLSDLLRGAGFRSMTITTADKHDEMIAFTSQLAHVVSNAYIKSPTATEHLSYSAGSYRDLTRVARLNETMWTELFLDNADHLGFELDCLIHSLQEYRDAIAAGDAETLCRLLKEGRERKESIDTE